LPRHVDLNERVAQDGRHRQRTPRAGDPNAIDHVKGFYAFWQDLAHQNGNIRFSCALIFAEFGEPAVAPIFGALGFPNDGTAGIPALAHHPLQHIPAEFPLD